MINLTEYRQYWERMQFRISSITGVLPVTLDAQMGKKIQSLPADSITLFILPPMAKSESRNADSYKETCPCVVFLMAKYDPQLRESFDVLQQTQPIIDLVKECMIADQCSGCPVMRVEVDSIETAPETELYGRFAGWSIVFNVKS